MKCLDGMIDSMDMSLSKLQETLKDRKAWRAAVHGVAKGWTKLSNWTITNRAQTPSKEDSGRRAGPGPPRASPQAKH